MAPCLPHWPPPSGRVGASWGIREALCGLCLGSEGTPDMAAVHLQGCEAMDMAEHSKD